MRLAVSTGFVKRSGLLRTNPVAEADGLRLADNLLKKTRVKVEELVAEHMQLGWISSHV